MRPRARIEVERELVAGALGLLLPACTSKVDLSDFDSRVVEDPGLRAVVTAALAARRAGSDAVAVFVALERSGLRPPGGGWRALIEDLVEDALIARNSVGTNARDLASRADLRMAIARTEQHLADLRRAKPGDLNAAERLLGRGVA